MIKHGYNYKLFELGIEQNNESELFVSTFLLL
jgi:hypothetical protein